MFRFFHRLRRKPGHLTYGERLIMSAIDDLNAMIDRVATDVNDILAILKNQASDDAAIEAAVTKLGGVATALEAAKPAPAPPAPPAAPPAAS